MNQLKVHQTRKILAHIRQQWSEHAPQTPINIYSPLPELPSYSIATFSLNYVLDHRSKRKKTKRSR